MADQVTTLSAGLTSNVDEPEAVPGGESYELKLVSVEVREQKPEKGDGKFVMAIFNIVGDATAKSVSHVMMLPGSGYSEKELANSSESDIDYRRNLGLQRFYDALGISHDEGTDIELTEGIGNTTWAVLSERDDPEYGKQNNIRRFVTED